MTARVQVWTGGAGFEERRVPLPEPGPGETLVRVRLATVCGSDLHTVSGRRPGPAPGVLGHEGVGEVVAAGPGAVTVAGEPLVLGDRVVWGVVVSCGDCDRCRAGRAAKCRRARKIGHEPYEGGELFGCYATHVHLPTGMPIVAAPRELPDAVAAPAGCATATVAAVMAAAIAAAGPLTGRRVLVSGAGMLGLTAMAMAAEAGAAEITAVDLDADRLRLAAAFGATRAGTPDEPPPTADVALEFSGAAGAVASGLAALDVGGVLVLAGSVAPGPAVAVDPERVVRNWLTVTGVHNYESHHLADAITFLARTAATRPWGDLVAEPVPLSATASALGAGPGRAPRASVAP
ncbi:alcohol dehydrogenase catalytic domain-containing protein [Streptosporangium oxazolinicum]|uniref:alcohol dehydrogenase n=1 Tax=Streptosporangium oxazolinicum TaxID=909287 RepID=A0ABP8BET5_9ACTN